MLQFLRLLASDKDDEDSDDEDDDPANFDLPDITLSRETTSFLDLGTGNGSLLSSLSSHKFSGRLHGIDYSPQSVALARKIAEAKGQPITFTTWDLLSGPMEDALGDQTDGYDVLLDKGTFDAISLSAATNDDGQRIMAGYRPRALSLLKVGGIFLITSCNWTEDELKGWFVNSQDETVGKFAVVGRVKYRTFSFGGVKGQTISTLCMQRVS